MLLVRWIGLLIVFSNHTILDPNNPIAQDLCLRQ